MKTPETPEIPGRLKGVNEAIVEEARANRDRIKEFGTPEELKIAEYELGIAIRVRNLVNNGCSIEEAKKKVSEKLEIDEEWFKRYKKD